MAVFLPKDVKYCAMVFLQYVTFDLPLSCVWQWQNCHQWVNYLICPAFLWITTKTLSLGWKCSKHKHYTAINLTVAALLILLAKIWPLCIPQTWHNFQPHQPYCSLVKLRHVMENNINTHTSPLTYVPTHASDIRMSHACHILQTRGLLLSDNLHMNKFAHTYETITTYSGKCSTRDCNK